MTTYATMTVGGGTNAGSTAQTTNAQFTGSFFNTQASGNYVRLTELSANFNGSFLETATADFTGSLFGTTNPTGSNAIYLSGTTGFTGSLFETATADFTGSTFNVSAISNALQLSSDPLFSGLIAYWKLNESSGTTVGVNVINTQQNCVLASGAFFDTTTKKIGAASLNLDGTNDYAFVPAGSVDGVFNFVGSVFSVSLWAYPYALPASNEQWGLVTYFTQASTNGWVFDLWNDGTKYIRSNMLAGGQAIVQTAKTLTLNEWSHLAFTRTSNGSCLIYHNGSLLVNAAQTTAGSTNNQLWIGGQLGLARFFSGLIDDVRIYNRTVPAVEIGSIFTQALETGSYIGIGSYLTTRTWNAGSFYNVGSLIWNSTSGTNEIVQAQYRVAPSGAGFGAFSSLNTGSALVIGSSNCGSVQALFLLSGPLDTSPTVNNWQIDYYTDNSYTGVGSYLETRSWNAGSYFSVGSIIWNATSGADQLVHVQYRTAGSNAAFGAFSSASTGSVVVVNGSNIGSVQVLFTLSGPATSTPSLDNWLLDYNSVASYNTIGSYLATLDLSGTTSEEKTINGIVWHSGGTGPISVDYRFSDDLVSFTGYLNDTTGSVSLVAQNYRYAQLRFNLSGTGAVE